MVLYPSVGTENLHCPSEPRELPQQRCSPTCELPKGLVGLHAKPLPILIERLQPELPGFLDDPNGHFQDIGVDGLSPTNLEGENTRRSTREAQEAPASIPEILH